MEEEKLRLAMEKTIQHVLKNQQQVSGPQIPREMVHEILNRLPRKSLARFKCVCKLWSVLINFILVQRLAEEIKWRVGKFTEAKRTLNAVMYEIDRRAVDVDDLRAFHVRVKAKIDDMLSVADFDQDYLNCFPTHRDSVSEFRGRVINWVREAEAFLSKIDALLRIFLPLQELLRKQ